MEDHLEDKIEDYLEDELDPSVLARLPWYETPLDPSKNCIRLLTLHPGKDNDALVCDLSVVSLDDKPEYETLSYVWGEPGRTRAITVAGARFDATANLADFLQCLRLPGAARTLWADAVCIDQESVREKSHQIGLMARVYRQATRANIWFGPMGPAWQDAIEVTAAAAAAADDDDDEHHQPYVPTARMTPSIWERAERHACGFQSHFVSLGGRILPRSELPPDPEDQPPEELLFETLGVLDDIARGKHLYEFSLLYLDGGRVRMNRRWPLILDCVRFLLTRPWWHRVWTLQEAVLPQVDALIYIGTIPVRLSRLVNGVNAIWKHTVDCCKRIFNLATAAYQNFPHGDWLSAHMVHHHRERFAAAQAPFIGIEEAISSTQSRKATDPRDHFFGVLGLLPAEWHGYFQGQGYACSTGDIFAQCSKLVYVNSGHLGELGNAVGVRATAVADLPSWAVDLTRGLGDKEDGSDRWALYDAAPGSAYDEGIEFMHQLQGPTLTIQALRIGEVAVCGVRTIHGDLKTPRERKAVVQMVSEWLKLYEQHTATPNSDGFWRAAFMDRNIWRYWLHKRQPLPAERLHDIRQWWASFAATGDERDLVRDRQKGATGRGTYHYRALLLNMEKGRFFCTAAGAPGLGPHGIRPGDEIHVLAGCRSPAVVRPRPDGGGGGEGATFAFVGLCFVDGWMYGEAARAGREWQSLTLK